MNVQNNMKTFKELYLYLQLLKDSSIFPFLSENWKGKEKQESLFRLFSLLNLFPQFKKYSFCEGNFNNKTIKVVESFSSYLNNTLKDSGDSSDATFLSLDKKELIATTSKNLSSYGIGDLNISNINDNFKQYNLSLRYCIVIRCKNELLKKAEDSRESSNYLSVIISRKNTILIDQNDIDKAYRTFKQKFSNTSIDKMDKLLLNKNKSSLTPRLHQDFTVQKSLNLIENNEKVILWGHLPRSGKSYMMAYLIYCYSIGRTEYNCLIITSVPNETIDQYKDIFNEHVEFEKFNVIHLDNVDKILKLEKINIIITSKQFLQSKGAGKKEKGNVISNLQKLDIYLRFVDETHYGGTSEISHNIYDLYGSDAPTIYMTATYFKPVSLFSIPKKSQIIWDLEDIKLCKNIDTKNQETLIYKHGNLFGDLITKYGINHIKDEYQKFPELHILNLNLDCNKKEDYIKVMNDNNVGFSFNTLFMLKTKNEDKKEIAIEQFQNESEMMKLCNKIFYKNNHIHSDFSFEVKDNLLERIETFCIQNNSRTFTKEKPLSILIFLPHGNYTVPIEKVSNTFKKFLINNKFMEDYEIITLSDTDNSKQLINEANIKVLNNNKKGLIILSGRKCSMGITIPNCDIVMLMNDIHSADLIYQMMTRCLSEDDGKLFGFVVDLNLQRQINVIMEYALRCKDALPPKETLKYLLKNRIIHLTNDIFEINEYEMDKFVSNLYSIWSNEPKNTIKTLQKTIYIKTTDIFSNTEQSELNKIFFFGKGVEKTKTKTKVHESKDINVHTGQERENNSEHLGNITSSSIKEEKIEEKVNFIQDIIEYIVPFVCIITCRNEVYTFKDMYNVIKGDKELLYITNTQFITWWGTNLPDNILDIVMNYYDKINYIHSYDIITKRIKHIFLECKDDRKKFAETVIEYFKPTGREKKNNAEIPTPRELKLEMISKVPEDFWTKKQKVLEPSVGKGGFCLEVIEFFMKGLEEKIPDDKERYKVIVEECLYFADINPVNIHITKLILDPTNEYKLNYYEGDFLKFELEDFELEGFDLVIGNPPYNDSSGNKGSGHNIWKNFVDISINKILNKNGFLLFVHPKGWRQIDDKIGKLLLSKQIHYLNMNNLKKGLEIFNCSTDYDYYLLENINIYKNTIINDYLNITLSIDLKNKRFIPNHSIEDVYLIIDYEIKDIFMYDRSKYGTEYNHVSKTENDIYKYPCIYTINKNNVKTLRWSSINTGHFDVTKFIFSNGEGFYKDYLGEYGLTEWAYALKCKKEELDNIDKAFYNPKLKILFDAVKLTSSKYNNKIIKYFKKDFWKDFIEESDSSSNESNDGSSDESNDSSSRKNSNND